MAASDKNFHAHINKKQETLEEGNEEMTPNLLMNLPDKKHKIVKAKEIWDAPMERGRPSISQSGSESPQQESKEGLICPAKDQART